MRYRYYVSHALLQRRKKDAGSITRVPAAQLERIVVEAVRARTQLSPELTADLSEREVVQRFVVRVVVCPNAVDMELREASQAPAADEDVSSPVTDVRTRAESACGTVIRLPWTTPAFLSVKGVLHQPDAKPTLKPGTRDAILLAIAKARSWIEDLASGRIRSFAEIAEREGKVERHIRLLTPLAFAPPEALAAIIAGDAQSDFTVTELSHTIPWAWTP